MKEEQTKVGENHKTEIVEENIVRTFASRSPEVNKENIEAALEAYNVYKELSKAGLTIEQMETDQNLRNLIGLAIHTGWLKRNETNPNESLKVPYNELDEWLREQKLIIFDALLSVVKQNKEKYKIEAVKGHILPDYEDEEFVVLQAIRRKDNSNKR